MGSREDKNYIFIRSGLYSILRSSCLLLLLQGEAYQLMLYGSGLKFPPFLFYGLTVIQDSYLAVQLVHSATTLTDPEKMFTHSSS